jgi:hypothetical protein
LRSSSTFNSFHFAQKQEPGQAGLKAGNVGQVQLVPIDLAVQVPKVLKHAQDCGFNLSNVLLHELIRLPQAAAN